MWRRLLLGATLAGTSACSLLLESSPSQCSTDADCLSRGAEFAASVCTDERCVVTPLANLACNTNVECTQKLGGPAICRARDRRCAALLSPECPVVHGDVTNDDTIVFGTMFTLTGTNGPAGLARQRSAELALDEIKQSVGGIRSGVDGRPRPLAIVECDDNLDSVKPAAHLVDDVGVQAIVGVASSSRVIEVATSVTIPKGVLLISPTATTPALTSLPDANLVWRTSPSDALQSIALVDQLPALEAKYRTDNVVPAATKLGVTFVYVNEAYGLGLYEAVTRSGQLNGKPIGDAANAGLSEGRTYTPNPTDLEPQIAATLAESPRPAIIVLFGTTEVVTKFMAPLESRWGTSAPRPLYLLADGGQKTELLDLAAADDALRKRVRGTVPAASRSSSNFDSFVFKYEGQFGGPVPSVFGMAGTYDAMFLLGYSVAAAGSRPLSGDELQKGFGKLVSGTKIAVGGTSMNAGFQALTSPGSFDFDGASGPLDFDLATGEARSNIDVWCIAKDATGRPVFAPSKRLFDATTNAMAGTFDAATCK
jgi:ABC-type branched-subunit amino acid transport system substrate-binding protein